MTAAQGSLRVTVISERPLRYAAGADPALDRPAHVRAASGLCPWEGGWILIQDDAAFLALIDAAGAVSALPLPPGPDGRRLFSSAQGNKAHKPDLEACEVLPTPTGPLFVAFGSGSTAARERVVTLRSGETPQVRQAPDLYASLRAEPAFAGSELNIEGAALRGDKLLLFQRGNGAAKGDLLPVNATCALSVEALLAWLEEGGAAPALEEVRGYALGCSEAGTPFGFTDAAAAPHGRVAFLAAAEASPNTYDDGELEGCRLGFLEGAGGLVWAPVLGVDGEPVALKLEGLAWSEAGEVFAVADMDDPEVPAVMCMLRIEEGGG